jgi:hypothetical protein
MLTPTRNLAHLERFIASFIGKLHSVITNQILRIPSARFSVRSPDQALASRDVSKEACESSSRFTLLYHLLRRSVPEYIEDCTLTPRLKWEALTHTVAPKGDEKRSELPRGYDQINLREEFREEQSISSIDPFLRFLEVAAPANAGVEIY